MPWSAIDDAWQQHLSAAQTNLSADAVTAAFDDCGRIGWAALELELVGELPDAPERTLLLIESELYGRVLYKGPFKPRLTISRVPYCTFEGDGGIATGDASDILSFTLVDLEGGRLRGFATDQGYPVYNGRINRVILLPEFDERYHGTYRIEQIPASPHR